MAEPVDPAADWACIRGGQTAVYYREFDPETDTHATAPGEAGIGMRGPKRVAEDGTQTVTRATWTLTSLAARPVLRSLIVDGSESWVVLSAEPDPASGEVFVCETVLNG